MNQGYLWKLVKIDKVSIDSQSALIKIITFFFKIDSHAKQLQKFQNFSAQIIEHFMLKILNFLQTKASYQNKLK